MQVTDRIVGTACAAPPLDVAALATRQPGILRYLESRFRPGSDALAVALETAARIHLAFELALGVPPDRAPSPQLERAEAALLTAPGGLGGALGADGAPAAGLARQPALAALVERTLVAPPLPLDDAETAFLGLALGAIVVALDSAASGLRIPARASAGATAPAG